jgi:hypothetical protein
MNAVPAQSASPSPQNSSKENLLLQVSAPDLPLVYRNENRRRNAGERTTGIKEVAAAYLPAKVEQPVGGREASLRGQWRGRKKDCYVFSSSFVLFVALK